MCLLIDRWHSANAGQDNSCGAKSRDVGTVRGGDRRDQSGQAVLVKGNSRAQSNREVGPIREREPVIGIRLLVSVWGTHRADDRIVLWVAEVSAERKRCLLTGRWRCGACTWVRRCHCLYSLFYKAGDWTSALVPTRPGPHVAAAEFASGPLIAFVSDWK